MTTSWWRLYSEERFLVDQGASLLIQLEDGQWIGAGVIPRTIVTLTVGPQPNVGESPAVSGALSVIYRPLESLMPTAVVNEASTISQNVIAAFRSGRLTGHEALNIAARIRTDKHVDPMLGAVAAYLYDSVGDRDSIRRIAYFFAADGQPIPFDVALLADLPGVSTNGRIRVDIPQVRERAPRTDDEAMHSSYFRRTPAIGGATVGGGFPWLRQGWDLLDTARHLPVHRTVVEVAQTRGALLPFAFATLRAAAGAKLADLIDAQEI